MTSAPVEADISVTVLPRPLVTHTVVDAGILRRCFDDVSAPLVALTPRAQRSLARPQRDLDITVALGYIKTLMTPREKLHLLVDELSDAEAEAALARMVRERELLRRWTASEDTEATEDAWALANAREAIREERW